MTKIIPDNPMTLLRKTGGPLPRNTFLDEVSIQGGKHVPGPRTPPTPQQKSPQVEPQNGYQQPSFNEREAPISPVLQQQIRNQQPQREQPSVQPHQRQSPQYQPQPAQYQPQPAQYQPQPAQYQPHPQNSQSMRQFQNQSPQISPEARNEQPKYQPPVIERQPMKPRQNDVQPDIKTSTAHLGSLYIPPADQQQQRRVVSPPSIPDSPNIQSPPLKEAPKPWQTKKSQQEEIPLWAKKENQEAATSASASPKQQWSQSEPVQQTRANHQQQPIGVRIEIRTNPASQYSDPAERKPNAVYVTQPLVLQDFGSVVPPQQKRNNNQGEVLIPIRVEGANQGPRTPPTPSSERSFNRQQSFGNNPSQSNSFKIIQKITNTDDDEDHENTPITRHSPRFPQNFQQTNEQMVPRGSQQPSNRGPQVRTIPIQIEGDYEPQEYVHPCEQIVPEPKKYTGSSIPSRSFKILQAMTAPDNCANVDDQNEAFPYDEENYYPYYPPYPFPPYWPHYYPAPFYPDHNTELSEGEISGGNTPIPGPDQKLVPMPFWLQPHNIPRRTPPSSEEQNSSSDPRTTLSPSLSNGCQSKPYEQNEELETCEDPRRLLQYPPYFDPYIFYYYYGYLPYAPHPHYKMGDSNAKHIDPYSFEIMQNSSSDTIDEVDPEITTNISEIIGKRYEKETEFVKEENQTSNNTDSDSDSESYGNLKQNAGFTSLKSIRSVNDINIYNDIEGDSDEDDLLSDVSEEDSDGDCSSNVVEDDTNPHVLSVILEESERTESRMRKMSVASDTTTIADSDNEIEANISPEVRLPLKFSVNVVNEENSKHIIEVENGNLKTFEETEIYASFTLKSPSSTPRKRSPCRDHAEDVNLDAESGNHELVAENISKGINEELEDDGRESDESDDWWGLLGKDEDDIIPRKSQHKEDHDNELEDVVQNIVLSQKVVDCLENNYASAVSNSETETIELKEFRELPGSDGRNINIYENNVCEINKIPISGIERDLVNEKQALENSDSKDVDILSSVYDTVENLEVDSSGTLMEMGNFVAQLEKFQERSGLWNNCTLTDKKKSQVQKVLLHGENILKSECEVEIKIKENSSFDANFEKSKETGFNKNLISNGQEKEIYNHIEAGNPTDECSADYTKYNPSESSRICGEEKKYDAVNNNGSYNKMTYNHLANESESDDSSDDSEYSSSEEEEKEHKVPTKKSDLNNNEETEVKIPSIKERIQALKDSIKQKQEKIQGYKPKIYVEEKEFKHKTTTSTRTKSTSTKSSIKSLEEFSEEEIDSGVTSDMSRHISDTEEFSELKKLTRYQRAATHSRLFKLLQDGCDDEDMEENENKTTSHVNKEQSNAENVQSRRDHLRLPLSKDFDSDKYPESNITSPVNERMVDELIRSFLKRKKAQVFRNMPQDKLFAAASKILHEEIESLETTTSCSSFLSPLRGSTGYSTAVHTPQEFVSNLEEYKQYYDSWKDTEIAYDEEYDIMPSKAFKLLQEHSDNNKTGAIAGMLAKCPRRKLVNLSDPVSKEVQITQIFRVFREVLKRNLKIVNDLFSCTTSIFFLKKPRQS
ncbi:hypothetical protein JTB14_024836 [Gonioctena quinquepunctata]|nr:hypothetical protein JTB14_024836 [Gonioctena quinquepunctata]